VNLLGSFLFGLVFASFENRGGLPASLRLIALSGFLGAFTTFSTLMFEVVALLEGGRTGAAVLHLLVHNGLGLGCILLGLWLGRIL
jgi:CrcB protein